MEQRRRFKQKLTFLNGAPKRPNACGKKPKRFLTAQRGMSSRVRRTKPKRPLIWNFGYGRLSYNRRNNCQESALSIVR